MRIVGLGVDLAEIDRVRRVLQRHPERFPQRVFTDHERAYAARYADPVPRLAARFAGKEAVMKSLGTGWRRIRWRDVEITGGGAPRVNLAGTAAGRARVVGATDVLVTITHTDERALVMAVAVAEDGSGGAMHPDEMAFRELMDRVAEGTTRGIPDLAVGCFTSGAVLVEAATGTEHTGHEALRHYFASIDPAAEMEWLHLSFDPRTRSGAGEFAFGDPAAPSRRRGVALVQVRDGHIVRWQEYRDPGPPS
jgi:holo-[acyl-carrier protein] synthase